MNCFYYSHYRFYNEHLSKSLKFFLISDIHFSHKVSAKKLRAITEQARQQQPRYILISGDLIDELGAIAKPAGIKRLTSWLAQLGKIAPTLIGLGNHDFYRKNPAHNSILSKKRHWYAEKNQAYIDAINAIDNVQVLNNEAFEDKDVYIFGFTQSPEYYQFDRDETRGSTLLHPGGEDADIMISDLDALDPKLITKLPKNKIKIAIIHSPVFLSDSEISSRLAEFDFFICGHMHNGVVPPIINDLWRSDRGIIAPGKKLFPHGSRASIRNPDDKLILLGAVSTMQASSKPLTFLNGIFPVHVATLELSSRKTLARKPDVKHEYIGF